MFPAAISSEVGRPTSRDGSMAWRVEEGAAMEVEGIGFDSDPIVVMTVPIVPGAAVLKDGRDC